MYAAGTEGEIARRQPTDRQASTGSINQHSPDVGLAGADRQPAGDRRLHRRPARLRHLQPAGAPEDPVDRPPGRLHRVHARPSGTGCCGWARAAGSSTGSATRSASRPPAGLAVGPCSTAPPARSPGSGPGHAIAVDQPEQRASRQVALVASRLGDRRQPQPLGRRGVVEAHDREVARERRDRVRGAVSSAPSASRSDRQSSAVGRGAGSSSRPAAAAPSATVLLVPATTGTPCQSEPGRRDRVAVALQTQPAHRVGRRRLRVARRPAPDRAAAEPEGDDAEAAVAEGQEVLGGRLAAARGRRSRPRRVPRRRRPAPAARARAGRSRRSAAAERGRRRAADRRRPARRRSGRRSRRR